MTGFLSDFHFLRPLWLLGLLPLIGAYLALGRAHRLSPVWERLVSPHLLKHIIVNRADATRLRPLGLLLPAGILGFLAEEAGLREKMDPIDYALGVKEIIELPEEKIQDRFNLEEGQGAAQLYFGTLTEDMARFLEAAVVSRRNIVVSGGTGSGKTTLINILSGYIPEHERTVTIEDAAELQLRQRNVVRLETKRPSPESPTEVTIRHCVVNALRMRPERIVVGECRSGEALDMLQAMNTGHDGSMTTVHANSPRDCLSRLETLVLMAGMDLPLETVRRQIGSAIHMIVQIARLRDGSRKVTHVTEILGMEGKNIVLQDVFLFYDEGDTEDGKVKGYHSSTGLRPKCSEAFKQYGFKLPPSMFLKPSRPG